MIVGAPLVGALAVYSYHKPGDFFASFNNSKASSGSTRDASSLRSSV